MKTIRILIMVMLLFNNSIIWACRCDDPGTTQEAYKHTPIIIYGKVIEKTFITIAETIDKDSLISIRKAVKNEERITNFLDAQLVTKIKFLILKTYKGSFTTDTVTIFTTRHGNSCGYTSFEKNKEYVIYGFSYNYATRVITQKEVGSLKNTFWTNHCTRTTDYIDPEIKILDEIKRSGFVEELRKNIENKKYLWSENKDDIPKLVFDYINDWRCFRYRFYML
jgi:hypothetical protein